MRDQYCSILIQWTNFVSENKETKTIIKRLFYNIYSKNKNYLYTIMNLALFPTNY